MRNIMALLKNKAVIGGIFMVVFYQVVFIGIFMSGYSAIPKNIPDLTVAIVNDDQQQGQDISAQLQKQMPFRIETNKTLEQAQKELDDRDIHMIVHIPADFTQKLSTQGTQAQLDFFINQSNPAMVTSTMQSVVSQITTKMNEQIAMQGTVGALKGLQIPEDQAKQLAEQIQTKLIANTVSTNPMPAGMFNQMAPMFLSMVSYVGAMIFSMIAVGAMMPLRSKLGKWKAFFALQGVHVLVSLIAPLIGLTIYFSIQGYGAGVFVQMWLLHALEMLAALELMSIFILLLGQGGMLINMTLLLCQTITSGAVMAQDMMGGLFKWISHISVMFYSVQADFSILFGGGLVGEHVTGLVLIAVISLLIGLLVFKWKSSKTAAPIEEGASQPVLG